MASPTLPFAALARRLPAGLSLASDPASASWAAWLTAGRAAVEAGPLSLPLTGIRRWVALARHGWYWNHPEFGREPSAVPHETQMLLWEKTRGGYGLCLPLLDGDLRATLRGTPQGLTVETDGALPGEVPETATLALLAQGDDPYALLRAAAEVLAARLRTFRTRAQKTAPAFLDYFGWCTWDAFYHSVDADKVLEGLRSFRAAGIQPGFLILDDGWLDTVGDYLHSLDPDPGKFPEGLAPLIRRAKEEFGLSLFGVWHAFMGYWTGLDPQGPLAAAYANFPNRGKIRPWLGENDSELDLHLLEPCEAARFYHDFHRRLHAAGVDLVKVDGQSALEIFTRGQRGRVGAMRAFQEALQGAAGVHFANNLIHCMCNGSDVAYHLQQSLVWRNSADYLPRAPRGGQQWHVFANAFNNLWSGLFAVPDWDMFQSRGPDAAFHAAARALSGGPVYVSDKPGAHDPDLLRRLVRPDGRILRFDQPALPSPATLWENSHERPVLTKIFNRHGPVGVLGIFHCCTTGESIPGTWSTADVPELAGVRFAVWSAAAQTLRTVRANQTREISLPPAGWDLLTLVPIDRGFAALGLLNYLAGAAALREIRRVGQMVAEVDLEEGGRAGCYCARPPRSVRSSRGRATSAYDPKSRLLAVDLPPGGPVTLEIAW